MTSHCSLHQRNVDSDTNIMYEMQHSLSTPDWVCLSWSVLLCVHMSRLSLCVQLTELHITYCTYVCWVKDHVALWFRCTCVSCSFQTTDQYSLWSVTQATSLSISPPSPTPTKRAAVSTQGAPHTSQWSSLCPLSQQSTSPPVGAVWSTHHPQPNEVCELPVHCHCTSQQPEWKPCCRGSHSHAK